MKLKRIRIQFREDDVWVIDTELVARNRAHYYAMRDSGFDRDVSKKVAYEAIFKRELETTLDDDFLLTDWIANEMDWSEIKDHAQFVPTPPPEINHDAMFSKAVFTVEEWDKTETWGTFSL